MVSIPLPVIPDVYRVTLNWVSSANSQIAANVMHFKMVTGNELSVKNAIDANVTAGMWQVVMQTSRVQSLSIIKLNGVNATVSFPVTGAKWAGSVSTQDFNPALSVIVKHMTGLRGRDNRGRTYLPMCGDASLDFGAVNGTNPATMNAAWAAFLSAMTSAVCLPVVAAYDRAHAGAGAHDSLIIQYLAETVIGTQRRRQQRLR